MRNGSAHARPRYMCDPRNSVPERPQVMTGGGIHRYITYAGVLIKNKVDLLPGVDLRGDGGYLVAREALTNSANVTFGNTEKLPRKFLCQQCPTGC